MNFFKKLVLIVLCFGFIQSASAGETIMGVSLDYLRYAIRGDFNGDGYWDVAVCSNLFGRSGVVRVFLGASGTSAVSGDMLISAADVTISNDASTTSYLITNSCVSGDVNGDGIDDIIFGSYDDDTAGSNAGIVYVVTGSSGLASTSLSSAIQFTGEAANDHAGYVAIGDVNGDGIDDIIVGAPDNDVNGNSSGAVYVVAGSSSLASGSLSSAIKIRGASANEGAGVAVATGDVNGDGIDDIIIGAIGNTHSGSYTGAVYVVAGSSSLASSWLSSGAIPIFGEAAGDLAGAAVATGDVNGDGIDDIIIGAYGNDDGGSRAGAVYIVTGSSSLASSVLSTAPQLVGRGLDHTAGVSLATGDMSGDGIDDIIIGADAGGGDLGAVYIVLGRNTWGSLAVSLTPGLMIRKFIGEVVSEAFGLSVGYFETVSAGPLSHAISQRKLMLGAWLNIDNGVGTGKIWLIDTLPTRAEGYQRTVR